MGTVQSRDCIADSTFCSQLIRTNPKFQREDVIGSWWSSSGVSHSGILQLRTMTSRGKQEVESKGNGEQERPRDASTPSQRQAAEFPACQRGQESGMLPRLLDPSPNPSSNPPQIHPWRKGAHTFLARGFIHSIIPENPTRN